MDNFERKTDYLRDIVGAYLLKDILTIDGLKNSSKMRDLLRLIAFQLGSEVSYEELGKQLGMSKNDCREVPRSVGEGLCHLSTGSLFS